MTYTRMMEGMLAAAQQALVRYKAADKSTQDLHDSAIVATYLSGVLQTIHFLRANDGAVTVEQMDGVLREVGKHLGLESGPP